MIEGAHKTKTRQDPKQWFPDNTRADRDCTVLEIWSRYHQQIADFRGFAKPVETTGTYTAALKTISPALERLPVAMMSAYDCWDAVVSVRYRPSGLHKGEPYAASTLQTRMTILSDIFLFLESMAVCSNPLWLPPWTLIDVDWGKDVQDIQTAVEDAAHTGNVNRRSLSRAEEQRLVRLIKESIRGPWEKRDGRYIGLALYLYAGMRPSEGRAIRYGNIKAFVDDPTRRKLELNDSADASGKRRGVMKTDNAPRCVGLHLELDRLLTEWEQLVRAETGMNDICNLPVICCENSFITPCTSAQLNVFIKKVLQKVLSPDDLASAALACYAEFADKRHNDAEDAALTTRVFRRNFCTKLYAETQLSDDEIRMCMGHERDDDQTKFDYAEPSVYDRMLAADHRMIDPTLRNDWISDITAGTHEIVRFDAGTHFVRIMPGLDPCVIEIDIEASEAGDPILAEFYRLLPEGAEMRVTMEARPAPNRPQHRLNTDNRHWPVKWPMEKTPNPDSTDPE